MQVRWITQVGVEHLPESRLIEHSQRSDGVLWAHMDHTDEAGMALLVQAVSPRIDDLREVGKRSPVPKLHMYGDHHFSAINGLARGSDGLLHFQPLKVFMTPTTLWTIFGPAPTSLTSSAVNHDLGIVRERVDRREIVPATPYELLAAIRIVMLQGQEDLLATGASRIGDLERRVMASDPVTAETVLQDLSELRHDLQTILINAAQAHELFENVLDTLSIDSQAMPIDTRRLALLRKQYGHLRNSAELEREYLQEVLDLFQTRVSNELNKFVRKITAYGTIAVSWTVVASIYGMNFTNMPELSWAYGYPVALGVMMILGITLWFLFRRQHWL